MKKQTFVIKKPLLGWATGEHLVYDPEWNEWTRKKTGQTFDHRQSIADGEVMMLLNFLRESQLVSILEPRL